MTWSPSWRCGVLWAGKRAISCLTRATNMPTQADSASIQKYIAVWVAMGLLHAEDGGAFLLHADGSAPKASAVAAATLAAGEMTEWMLRALRDSTLTSCS